jgi:hypothetical protein
MITFPKLREIFTSEEESKKDVLHIVISDTHSGSNYALFVDRVWHGAKTSHTPRSGQVRIRKHWEKFKEDARVARQGRRVRLIHNGDAIDGDHHHSGDVCTLNSIEQADLHIELMNELQKGIEWQSGDEMYYTRGTQTHVNEFENYIGRELNAMPNGDLYVWDLLALNTNGALSWVVHHGPRVGQGANETNSLYNWLKGIYYDALKDRRSIPDIVYTGHVHQLTYTPFGYRLGMEFHNMHGVILPSWQMKTTYAWEKAPVSKNKIGGVIHEIKSDGTVTIPKFCVMETE